MRFKHKSHRKQDPKPAVSPTLVQHVNLKAEMPDLMKQIEEEGFPIDLMNTATDIDATTQLAERGALTSLPLHTAAPQLLGPASKNFVWPSSTIEAGEQDSPNGVLSTGAGIAAGVGTRAGGVLAGTLGDLATSQSVHKDLLEQRDRPVGQLPAGVLSGAAAGAAGAVQPVAFGTLLSHLTGPSAPDTGPAGSSLPRPTMPTPSFLNEGQAQPSPGIGEPSSPDLLQEQANGRMRIDPVESAAQKLDEAGFDGGALRDVAKYPPFQEALQKLENIAIEQDKQSQSLEDRVRGVTELGEQGRRQTSEAAAEAGEGRLDQRAARAIGGTLADLAGYLNSEMGEYAGYGLLFVQVVKGPIMTLISQGIITAYEAGSGQSFDDWLEVAANQYAAYAFGTTADNLEAADREEYDRVKYGAILGLTMLFGGPKSAMKAIRRAPKSSGRGPKPGQLAGPDQRFSKQGKGSVGTQDGRRASEKPGDIRDNPKDYLAGDSPRNYWFTRPFWPENRKRSAWGAGIGLALSNINYTIETVGTGEATWEGRIANSLEGLVLGSFAAARMPFEGLLALAAAANWVEDKITEIYRPKSDEERANYQRMSNMEKVLHEIQQSAYSLIMGPVEVAVGAATKKTAKSIGRRIRRRIKKVRDETQDLVGSAAAPETGEFLFQIVYRNADEIGEAFLSVVSAILQRIYGERETPVKGPKLSSPG